MTYDERVTFYETVCDLPREEAEAQARRDTRGPDLEPWSPPTDANRFLSPDERASL